MSVQALRHHWFVVAQSSELTRKPLARQILGEPLVLFRGEHGQVGVFQDRCPHRNAPLSKGWVQQGQLVCPYHGWRFDSQGTCVAVPGYGGPAAHNTRAACAYAVHEQDGLIWASLAPESPQPSYRPPQAGHTTVMHQFTLQAGLLDALENFLDGTHTHFVHAGVVRREQPTRKLVTAHVRGADDRVEAHYIGEGQQSGIINELFGAGIDSSLGRFVLPSTVELEYLAGDTIRFIATLFFTPESDNQLRVFALARGNTGKIPAWLLVPPLRFLLNIVVKQDRQILEIQRQNIERFGGEHYTSTELDLLRPHILRLWRHSSERTPMAPFERKVEMLI
jgi:phenylpropionate dioxygenase-like ring-hydroxylating dioxygenase large terminal subunit